MYLRPRTSKRFFLWHSSQPHHFPPTAVQVSRPTGETPSHTRSHGSPLRHGHGRHPAPGVGQRRYWHPSLRKEWDLWEIHESILRLVYYPTTPSSHPEKDDLILWQTCHFGISWSFSPKPSPTKSKTPSKGEKNLSSDFVGTFQTLWINVNYI